MSSFLEITIDKFTFRVASDRLYSKDGTWVSRDPAQGTRVRVGLSDYLQRRVGDMAFVSVSPVGKRVKIGEAVAQVETIKVTFDLASPVEGTIVTANGKLEAEPELVNQSPYENGWLAEIEIADWDAAKAGLLDAPAFLEVMKEHAKTELIK